MVDESTEFMYSRKIRIYPNKEQLKLFTKSIQCSNYLYNQALAGIRDKTITKYSPIDIRKSVLKPDKELDLEENKHLRWQKDVPYDTRDSILRRLSEALKENFKRVKEGTITKFSMKFKSRKNPKQTFYVNKKALNPTKLTIFIRRLKGSAKLRLRKKMLKQWEEEIKTIEGIFCITKECGRWYICLPFKRNIQDVKGACKYDTVALDPGVRTFQTFYSESNVAGKIGDGLSAHLLKFGKQIDKLKSVLDTCKHLSKQTRHNIKHRCSLLRAKIKNSVKDLHWKTCNFLTTNFKTIFLPPFEVKNMTSTKIPHRIRCINSKTVRSMLCLSHFAFKERLKYMCRARGNNLFIESEAYTTKTCGGCGSLKDMAGLKTYKCQVCGFTLDRDYNASRNIYMKVYIHYC